MKVFGDLKAKSYDDNCHGLACLKQKQNSKNTITWYSYIVFKLDEVTGEVSRRWTRVYLRFSTLVWLQILPKLSILISLALCVSTLHTTFGHTWPAFHWFHISDENKKRKWMMKFCNALHTLQLVISGWHGYVSLRKYRFSMFHGFTVNHFFENFLVFDGRINKWKIEDVLLCRYFLSRIITAGKHHWILEQDMKRHQWVI